MATAVYFLRGSWIPEAGERRMGVVRDQLKGTVHEAIRLLRRGAVMLVGMALIGCMLVARFAGPPSWNLYGLVGSGLLFGVIYLLVERERSRPTTSRSVADANDS